MSPLCQPCLQGADTSPPAAVTLHVPCPAFTPSWAAGKRRHLLRSSHGNKEDIPSYPTGLCLRSHRTEVPVLWIGAVRGMQGTAMSLGQCYSKGEAV